MLLYTFRGIVNRDLTPDVVWRIGFVAGRDLLEKSGREILLVGDHRVSTEMVKCALKAGLLCAGVDVIECGIVPSPTLAFMVKRRGIAGAMVTASHNPPEWNGIQFLEPDSHIYGPEWEERIRAEIEGEVVLPEWMEVGEVKEEQPDIEGYLGAMMEKVRPGRRLKVVADVGGGTAALVMPRLLETLDADFEILNGEMDPFFRCRPSEPRPECLAYLCRTVMERRADVGFAYDGDADRCVVVDENGQFVEGDKIVLLLCRHLFSPGPIVLNASISLVAEQVLAAEGFTIYRERWGQTFMGRSVRDRKALFGGEPNGHYIFPEFSLRSDGIATTAFLYDLMSNSEDALSQMLGAFRDTVMINETIEWERDLADFRDEMMSYGKGFSHVEALHERLFVFVSDHRKLAVRQSPFDGTLRIFGESYDEAHVAEMVSAVKKMLGAYRV